MLLFEHDAKELLAVQGIPVPGGIRLEHVPTTIDETADGRSGPWIVKPQIQGGHPTLSDHFLPAQTNAEVSAAAAKLIGTTIAGQTVHSVWVERQFTPLGSTAISFKCDWASAGIRVSVGGSNGDGTEIRPASMPTMVLPPDPGAVIDGVKRLASALPSGTRECVEEAGRLLTPLFFGYEALELTIDPLMLLNDGGWAVGGARLSLDENAFFRHPELVSLVNRRDYAYQDVRLWRLFGLEHRIIDSGGSVAVLANGRGSCAYMADELAGRGVTVHSVTTANAQALGAEADSLAYWLDWLRSAEALGCLSISIAGDTVDLMAFAQRLSQALLNRPDFVLPTAVRLLGDGAAAAGAMLMQVHPTVHVEPMVDAALNFVSEHLSGPPA